MLPQDADLVLDGIEHGVTLAGGASTFQYLTFTVITAGMLSGGFFLYSLPYFQKVPQLECLYSDASTYVPCTQTEACTTPGVKFQADPTDVNLLDNWVN